MSDWQQTSRLKVLQPDELKQSVCVVVGTRPGIIKQSPIIRALAASETDFFVFHTGQHYSYEMDSKFFEDLQLPAPAYHLNTVHKHWTHGGQTAQMLEGIEEALMMERPRFVIVGGDANTNLAGALAARKLHLLVGHVEAGLRSGDWRMPEEHNRVMIDHISDFLFAPTEAARTNLEADNVRGQIVVTGNTIVDAVNQNVQLASEASDILHRLDIQPRKYFLVTLHREETVDSATNLGKAVEALAALSASFPDRVIVFPAHPRTFQRLKTFGMLARLEELSTMRITRPLGYLDFLVLLRHADLVLTDSGGLQEEACILGVPCVTLRDNTERPETVAVGANVVAGLGTNSVLQAAAKALRSSRGWSNPFGDGHAADRIVSSVREALLTCE